MFIVSLNKILGNVPNFIFFLSICRNLFERVTNLRLSTRKMKFFFKKYLDFEQKYGTPELVIGVRKKALEYVEDSHETDSGSET